MEERNIRDRKILVVGAAGRLGSEICKLLCSQGKGVIAVDDVSTGDLSTVEELYTLRNFRFIRSDIANLDIPLGVGTIIFLPNSSTGTGGDIFNTNIDGLVACLDYCSDNMCKIIYGSNPTPLSPLDGSQLSSAHHLSRQYGETMVRRFYEKNQIGSIIARISEVYGPSIGGGRLIDKMTMEALSHGTITIPKEQNSARSYLHSQDFCAMMAEALEVVQRGGFGVVDMNGPDVLTSSDLAKEISSRIKDRNGDNSAIIYRGRRYSHKRAVSSVGKSVISTRPRLRLLNTIDAMISRERKKR